jgi:hypothetical protein
VKRSRFVPARVLYLWEKFGLKRIELFTSEDLEKKPEIPQDKRTGLVKRLKEQQDEKESRRDKLLQKIKGFRKRK